MIVRLTGPVTLPNVFVFQSYLRGAPLSTVHILDFKAVPYIDSAGMGALINHYVHCQKKSVPLIVAGVSSRVLELFKLTKMDTVMSLFPTVEVAEASL
ncbi:MAG: STAS domain-containing protein [Terracidiphilus sp.]